MIAQAAMLAVMCLVGGILLLVSGLQPTEVVAGRGRAESPAQVWARISRRPAGPAGRRRDLQLLVAVVAGLVVFVLTGWVITLVVVPALAMIAPKLLGQNPPSDIPLLEALDRWVRGLSTVLPGGRDVLRALRLSRRNVPPLLAGNVDRLIQRLDARMEPEEALQRMGDELDNPEADAVIASLKLAVSRTQGVSANLKAIGENIQERLEALREVEAERARPRTQARSVTLLTAALIAGLALFGHGYFASLNTPIGQIVVAVCAGIYVTGMVLMYRITLPRRRPRILISGGGR